MSRFRQEGPRRFGCERGPSDFRPEDFIQPRFGWWFTGLVDGEGCFTISDGGCSFTIKLRADDAPMLERVHAELGIGKVMYSDLTAEGPRRPQVRFQVWRQAECMWLTDLFDAFPLESKKARDYAVWREAAIEWACGAPAHQIVANYKHALLDAREYQTPEVAR